MEKINKTIKENEFKLFFFITLTTIIILVLGYLISDMFNLGSIGMIASVLIAVGSNFISYFFSKNMVLKSQRAIPMSKEAYPEYYNMVKNMCEQNNILMPELYYIETPALNAFATGRNQKNAAVVITSGMLKQVPLDEISGVIGHELSHIVHKDIMVMSFITTLVGCMTIFASTLKNQSAYSRNSRGNSSSSIALIVGIAAAIVAPIAGMLIQMAVSRSREYMADATGGQFCGNPKLLAKALYRISHDGNPMPMANSATAPLYISNPLKNNIITNLFSTHPNIEDRINRLNAM